MGESFTSTNGILQGCPLSVVLLNMMIHIWVEVIGEKVPLANPSAYADDLSAIAATAREIRQILHHTQRFCELTGMMISAGKSGVWATSRSLRTALQGTCVANGEVIPLIFEERNLGAFVSFTKRKCKSRIAHTEKACKEIIERICGLKLHLEARSHLVAAMVLPKALYAAGVSAPNKEHLNRLRACCAKAVWGQSNRWRAVEVMFCLLTKGHLVDPVQKFSYDCLVSMRKSAATAPTHGAHFCQSAGV